MEEKKELEKSNKMKPIKRKSVDDEETEDEQWNFDGTSINWIPEWDKSFENNVFITILVTQLGTQLFAYISCKPA